MFQNIQKENQNGLVIFNGKQQAGILSCSKHGISETGSSKIKFYISEYLNNGDLLGSHQVS